jgi:hypothetical protein
MDIFLNKRKTMRSKDLDYVFALLKDAALYKPAWWVWRFNLGFRNRRRITVAVESVCFCGAAVQVGGSEYA